MSYLWNKININYISEVKFYITDDEDREVDLNDIDISLTVVLKETLKNPPFVVILYFISNKNGRKKSKRS